MRHLVYIGDARVDAVPADGRGVAYGDGLFETMRVHRGAVHWRDAHWARLEAGARRLRLALPDRRLVEAQADALLHGKPDALLKLIVMRGAGGRGYAPASAADPVWILSRHALPAPSRAGGLVLRWCDTRLALQPMLAGIKHCNRLEQVMARGEWQDEAIDEGLMRDTDGNVVCATAANVFVLRDGKWTTPPVEHCGIAGVCRAWAVTALEAGIAPLSVAQLESADAVFLCNAARGILPVARLGARSWLPHRAVADAMRRLADAHPAFADSLENS